MALYHASHIHPWIIKTLVSLVSCSWINYDLTSRSISHFSRTNSQLHFNTIVLLQLAVKPDFFTIFLTAQIQSLSVCNWHKIVVDFLTSVKSIGDIIKENDSRISQNWKWFSKVSFHTISKTVTFLPPTKELEKARLAFWLSNIIQFVVKKIF